MCGIAMVTVKVTEVRKLRKWPISKSISSASMHAIKRLTVNYDTSRQRLNFNWTDLIFFLVRRHMTFKRNVSPFASWQSLTGLIFHEQTFLTTATW